MSANGWRSNSMLLQANVKAMRRAQSLANPDILACKEPDRSEIADEMHQLPIGRQIGEWTVAGQSYRRRVRQGSDNSQTIPTTPCYCSCSPERIRPVTTHRLRAGRTMSCGCKARDRFSKVARAENVATWMERQAGQR